MASLPRPEDWGFEAIRAEDPLRADRLERCLSPADLVVSLSAALSKAVRDGAFLVGWDSKDNAFRECRSVLQFPIPVELFDWFFNARTGYRACFWASPDNGLRFNAEIIDALLRCVARHFPELDQTLSVRRILLEICENSRAERTEGEIRVTVREILRSLNPGLAKAWICERR